METERDLGRMEGSFESFKQESTADRKHIWEVLNQQHQEVMQQLKIIQEELSMYKTAIRLVKFGGLVFAALLTFKFGDLSELWHKVMK